MNQSIKSGEKVDEGTSITITVNKLAESKNLTVSINVKAITGGYTESTDETETETISKKVNIKVNDETRVGVDKNETNYSSIILSGKDGERGQVTVVITDKISGETLYSSSKTVTYGSQDTVSFN